jgi:hypothetical protein
MPYRIVAPWGKGLMSSIPVKPISFEEPEPYFPAPTYGDLINLSGLILSII